MSKKTSISTTSIARNKFPMEQESLSTLDVEVEPICTIEVRVGDLPEVEVTENWRP